MILESDQISMKILDYLNKRVAAPKTSSFPLISSVVLIAQNSDPDVLQTIEGAGGANAVIHLPKSTSDILSSVLDVLYRRKLVETTFRDLKVIDQTERYPYLSIFAKENQLGSADGGDDGDESMQNSMDNKANGSMGVNVSHPGNTFAIPTDLSYIVLKNNEDWTHCSSMLPRAIKKLRRKERQKHPLSGRKPQNTLTEKLHKEMMEREKTDNSILKKLQSPAALSAQQIKSDLCDNEESTYGVSVQQGDSRDGSVVSVRSSPSNSDSDDSDDNEDVDEGEDLDVVKIS